MNAKNDSLSVDITAVGALTTALVGVNGTAALIWTNDTTHATVSNQAKVTITDNSAITATDKTWNIFVTGALAKADGVGFGAAVELNIFTRDTQAGITGETPAGDGFFRTGTLDISSTNTGFITGDSIAAAVVWKSSKKEDESTEEKEKREEEEKKKEDSEPGALMKGVFSILSFLSGTEYVPETPALGDDAKSKLDTSGASAPTSTSEDKEKNKASFGIAVAGAGTVNIIKTNADAFVKNANVTITKADVTTPSAKAAFSVKAFDDSDIFAITGGISVSKGNEDSTATAAIAGAFSYNQILGKGTEALVSGSTVTTNTGGLAVVAENASTIFAVGASGSVALGGGSESATVAGSGAVIINYVGTGTDAKLTDTTITNTGKIALTVSAHDDSEIDAYAATLAFSKAKSGANVTVGADVALNRVFVTTDAAIGNVTLSSAASAITATALNEADIFAISGAITIGYSSGGVGVGVSGNFAYNQIGSGAPLDSLFADGPGVNATRANIYNLRGTSETALGTDAFKLSAETIGEISSIAGIVNLQLGTGSAVGVGAAWIQNAIGTETLATLGAGTKIKLTGTGKNAIIKATNSSEIETIAATVGVVTSGYVNVSGAIAFNAISGKTKATVSGALDAGTANNISVTAEDTGTIASGAGGISVCNNASGGFAIAGNEIANDTQALVTGSSAALTGATVDVKASSHANIASFAVGAAGATDGVAGGFSFSYDEIGGTLLALVSGGAHINATGALTITALDATTINTLAGQINASSKASVGASVALAAIGNSVHAGITGGNTGTSSASLTVRAGTEDNNDALDKILDEELGRGIHTAAIAGGASGKVAGSGAITANTITREVLSEVSAGANVTTTAGGVSLAAADSATIASLAGAINGAGTAAIGASLAYNTINGGAIAQITGANSKVTTTGNGVSLNAISDASIRALAIAGGGAGTVSFSLSGAYNAIGTALISGLNSQAPTTTINNVDGWNTTGTANRIVRATIADGAEVNSAGALALGATDTASIYALVGAVGGSGTANIGGSLVYNHISGVTEAVVDGGKVTKATTFNAAAVSDADIVALTVAAGGAGTANIVGAVAINIIDDSRNIYAGSRGTAASITGLTGATNVTAFDKSRIISLSVAGGGAGTANIGGASTVNYIGGNTSALLSGTFTSTGTVTLDAEATLDAGKVGTLQTALRKEITDGTFGTESSDLETVIDGFAYANIYTAAVSGGGAGTASITGSVTLNKVTRNITSGSSGNTVSIGTGNDFTATAKDTAGILSIAGAVNGAGTVAIGASLATNKISGTVETKNTAAITARNVSLTTSTTGTIKSIAAAGGGAGTVAANGAVTLNEISRNVLATNSGNSAATLGTVSFSVTDSAVIHSLAGAVSGAGTVAFGASLATNKISGTVESKNTGNLTAASLALSSSATGAIKSIAAGGGGSGTVAANGSVTLNEISRNVLATNSGAITASTGAVTLSATDSASIDSLAGAVSGAGVAAFGAAVATNTISGNISAQSSGNITAASLALNSSATGAIQSASVAGGGSGTVSANGSVTLNNISRNVLAQITGGTSSLSGAVSLTATDSASIDSLAGTLSAAGTVAVGASVATNQINGSVLANITGTTTKVTTSGTGAVTLTALASGAIRSLAITGGGAGIVAGSVSGAYNAIGTAKVEILNARDAENWNLNGTANRAVRASIANGAEVSSNAALSLGASDTASISALVGAASGAGIASLGASVVYNHISGATEAVVDGGKVTKATTFTANALSDADIVALTVAAGGAGVAAVNGAVAINIIDNSRSIYAGSRGAASVTGLTGATTVNALDKSRILSIGVAGGGAGIASVGAAATVNYIGGNTSALLSGAFSSTGTVTLDASASLDSTKATALKNAIKSDSSLGSHTDDFNKTLDGFDGANIYTAAVAGGAAGGVAVNGAVTINNIKRNITSGASNASSGTLTSGALTANATDSSKIYSAAGAVNGSGTAAIAGALAINKITGTTTAKIEKATVNTSTAVTLNAKSTATISAAAISGTGAGTFAAAVNVSRNILNNTVAATINGGQVHTTNGNIALKAEDLSTINTGYATIAGAGAVAIGGTSLENNITTNTKAEIYGNADVDADAGSVSLDAISNATIKAVGGSAALAGGVSVSGLSIINSLNNVTLAFISGASTDVLARDNLTVNATRTGSISISNVTASASLLASVGVSVLQNNIGGSTTAQIDGAKAGAKATSGTAYTYEGSNSARGVIVRAVTSNTITGLSGGISVAGGYTVGGTGLINNISGSTRALATNATLNDATQTPGAGANQSAVLFAQDTTTITDKVGQASVSLGFTLNGVYDTNTISKTVEAKASNSKLNAKTSVIVRALSTDTISSTIGAASIGLVSGTGVVANSKSTATVNAEISGASSVVTSTGTTTVKADSTTSITMNQLGASAGIAGAAGGVGLAEILNTTSAKAGGTIKTTGALSVSAGSTETINSALGAGAVGALAVAVSVSVNTIRSTTSAEILASALVNQDATSGNGQSVSVTATDNATITDTVGGAAAGLIAGAGAVGVDTLKSSATATIGTNAWVSAGGDVTVNATSGKTLNAKAASAAGALIAGGAANIVGTLGGSGSVDTQSKLSELGISSITGSTGLGSFTATTSAAIGSGAQVSGRNLSVTSSDTAKADVQVGSISGGLLSVGTGWASVKIANNTSATAAGTLSATGNVSINASTTNNSSSVKATAGTGALAAASVATATLNDNSSTIASLANSANITKAGTVTISGTQNVVQTTNAGIDAYGVVSGGTSQATTNSSATLQSLIGTGAQIGSEAQKVTSVSLTATGTYEDKANAKGSSAGIVSGGTNNSTTNAQYSVYSKAQENSKIYATGAVTISGTGKADAASQTQAHNNGGVTFGPNNATAKGSPDIYAAAETGTQINAGSIAITSESGWKSSGISATTTGAANGIATITTHNANATIEKSDVYNSRANVGGNAILNATGNVNINATSNDKVYANATFNGTFSALAFPNLNSTAYIDNKIVDSTVGTNAKITGANIDIKTYDYSDFSSTASFNSTVDLATFGTARAYGGIRSDKSTKNTITINNGADIEATENLNVFAQGKVRGDVTTTNKTTFAFTSSKDSFANAYSFGTQTVTVGSATLKANNINIRAESLGVNVATASWRQGFVHSWGKDFVTLQLTFLHLDR